MNEAVKHVVIVVLENSSFDQVAGGGFAARMPYLASLAARGVTLDRMYAIGHASLGNYLAMTSGNAPNAKTSADCLQYDCVYPRGRDADVVDQLEHRGLTWKGYMDGMTAPCRHPARSGGADTLRFGYATRHDPFVYYGGIVDDPARCAAHVVPFTQLATHLAAGQLPSYSFISPSTCHDAHDGGSKCGLTQADAWLQANIQPVLDSPSFHDGGVLIVTTDESDSGDTAGCCGNASGGHIASFVVSPLVARPGSRTSKRYTHYSTLRWVEQSFGLACLRHACDKGTRAFGRDVFAPAPAPVATSTSASR